MNDENPFLTSLPCFDLPFCDSGHYVSPPCVLSVGHTYKCFANDDDIVEVGNKKRDGDG